MTLSASRLRTVLSYDQEAGVFRRLLATSRSVKVGDIAGSAPKVNGYIHVAIDGRSYLAHRLAWLHVHGVWPANDIDHINGKRDDNRIANLRDVTRSDNLRNQRVATAKSRSGLIGAHFHNASGLYFSRIRTSEGAKSLGYFKTAESAHEAYKIAKRRYHATCTI